MFVLPDREAFDTYTHSSHSPHSSSRPAAAAAGTPAARSTGVGPFLLANAFTSCSEVLEPCFSRPVNSGPQGGSRSSLPDPFGTSSFPSCHTSRPLLMVVVTLPCICLPAGRRHTAHFGLSGTKCRRAELQSVPPTAPTPDRHNTHACTS